MTAGTTPAWTAPAPRQTAPASPRAAAGPGHRCCPPRRSSRPQCRAPSPGRSPRTGVRSGHALPPGRAAQPAAPAPSPAPALPATPDSGHQTLPGSAPGYATIAFARCPLRRDLEVSATPIVPVQRAPLASTRPPETLFTRWIEAKGHLLSQHLSYDQNKVDAPRVMMTFAAVPAAPRLAKFLARPIIRGHDMRQFMQACLFACADVISVVRADLDQALKSVSVAASLSTHHGYGVGVCRERSLEPVHLLDGNDVTCTMLIAYYAIILDQHCA